MTLSQPLVSYDKDFNLWLEQTVNLLKAGHFSELDIDHLVDELESMSRRDKREILSRLKVLLLHLLKWQYQPQQRSPSWRSSIQNNRMEIRLIIEDSPSLKNYPITGLDKVYGSARRDASGETGLPLDIFPVMCPFSIREVLDEEFWPQTK
ncbi:MAG: DUF29 domain-containing protein [Acaryochloris sp. SU_5_25]|nr:DUF29 domain-containing protein [Acaryochloris sp. SU_5_25]